MLSPLSLQLQDTGALHYFLGVEVLPLRDGIFLSQHKYIHDLLHNTKMNGAQEVRTPLSTSLPLKLHDGTASIDSTEYRKGSGKSSIPLPHSTRHLFRCE
ncbi:hypothetical protein Peur_061935 [Populus x canadensis]